MSWGWDYWITWLGHTVLDLYADAEHAALLATGSGFVVVPYLVNSVVLNIDSRVVLTPQEAEI